MAKRIGLECLCLELVEEREELACRSLNDSPAVLPDGVLLVVPSTGWITLVLMNVVHPEASGEWFPEDKEPHPVANDALEVV